MRIAACALTAAALILAGCGDGGKSDVLSETAANLGKIRSGEISLSLRVVPSGGGELRFEARGPVLLAKPGPLPVANLDYTGGTLISTGTKASLRVGGTTRPFSPAETDRLRAATASLRSGSLSELHLDEWIEHPRLSDGGPDTDRIHGGLDTGTAVERLTRLSDELGVSLPALGGLSPALLERATRSASVDLYTGKRDRLLHRLRVDADLGFAVPFLGEVAGADVTFDVEIDHPDVR
jgi:hypothetical protein